MNDTEFIPELIRVMSRIKWHKRDSEFANSLMRSLESGWYSPRQLECAENLAARYVGPIRNKPYYEDSKLIVKGRWDHEQYSQLIQAGGSRCEDYIWFNADDAPKVRYKCLFLRLTPEFVAGRSPSSYRAFVESRKWEETRMVDRKNIVNYLVSKFKESVSLNAPLFVAGCNLP